MPACSAYRDLFAVLPSRAPFQMFLSLKMMTPIVALGEMAPSPTAQHSRALQVDGIIPLGNRGSARVVVYLS